MSLLNDVELLNLLQSQSPLVRDFPSTVAREIEEDPFGPNSPVQPSSIDLHVGEIYLPGNDPNAILPHKEYSVPPGHSVIAVTHEVLNVPADMGAVAFPLAGRGQRGLSMMNAGHIDPGYEGKLWFSFINLGRDKFLLSQGDHVSTVLFWRLSARAERPWKGRRGPEVPMTAPVAAVESIAGDALMLETRAKEAARQIVTEHMTEVRSQVAQLRNELLLDLERQKGYVSAEFKNKAGLVAILSVILPVVVTAFLTYGAQILFPNITGVRQLEKDTGQLGSAVQVMEGEMKNHRSYLEAKSLEINSQYEKVRLRSEQQDPEIERLTKDVEALEKRLSKDAGANQGRHSP